jgi:hypothetical protein
MNHHSTSQQNRQVRAAADLAAVLTSNARHQHTVDANGMVAGGRASVPQNTPTVRPEIGQASSQLENQATCLRADPELSRTIFGLKKTTEFRYWLILHDTARESGQQGFNRRQFIKRIKQLGIKNTAHYVREVLNRGIGEFWNYVPHTDMIYPYGFVDLANRMTRLAVDSGLYNLVASNAAGGLRDMYLDVSGTIYDFEAHIIQAWYAARTPTISRAMLCDLFGRDVRSLRYLEKRAGVKIIPNEVETTDPAALPLTPKGELRGDVYRTYNKRGKTVWHYRLPNTYQSNLVRQHPSKGQGRKASFTIEQFLASQQLPGISTAGDDTYIVPGKSNRMSRRYCNNSDVAQRSRKWGNKNMLYVLDKPSEGSGLVWRAVMYLGT